MHEKVEITKCNIGNNGYQIEEEQNKTMEILMETDTWGKHMQ